MALRSMGWALAIPIARLGSTPAPVHPPPGTPVSGYSLGAGSAWDSLLNAYAFLSKLHLVDYRLTVTRILVNLSLAYLS